MKNIANQQINDEENIYTSWLPFKEVEDCINELSELLWLKMSLDAINMDLFVECTGYFIYTSYLNYHSSKLLNVDMRNEFSFMIRPKIEKCGDYDLLFKTKIVKLSNALNKVFENYEVIKLEFPHFYNANASKSWLVKLDGNILWAEKKDNYEYNSFYSRIHW